MVHFKAPCPVIVLFSGVAGGISAVAREVQPLGRLFTHLVLEHLTCSIHGEGIDEFDVTGHLMAGHACLDVIRHLLHGDRAGLLQHDTCQNFLAVLLIGNTDDLHILHSRVGIDSS